MSELRLVVVLALLFTVPGWAALTIGQSWQRWSGLQRWAVAIGLSVAFYPLLFYALRAVLPSFTLGPYKMGLLLLACAAFVAWRLRRDWRSALALERLEWLALAVLGMTLFTRFWLAHLYPYPAWSDSLHHTLLTQLTATRGTLPFSLEPYFPLPLGQYHLGLYALSATVQWLAQVPAHTALLWSGQALSGLCGVGVYLVLDRRVGRVGAIVGAALVGLLSHQPAFYVNWGRFTQVGSQAILLIAWLVTWETIARWRRQGLALWDTALSAALTAAVFLLHFQVAAFYLLLLAIAVVGELGQGICERRLGWVVAGTAAIGVLALLASSPALWEALQIYVARRLHPPTAQLVVAADAAAATDRLYYEFAPSSIPYLAARPWLLVLAASSAVVALARRNGLAWISVLWTVLLCLLGMAYLLDLPLLRVTNMGAVLIMLYLPIGLLVGAAVEEGVRWAGKEREQRWGSRVVAGVLLVAFCASHWQTSQVEPYRYFVTPQDVTAMDWIRQHTPADAVFAVNTTFWLPQAPHGTDAGYWIPYFTGRQTTASAMVITLGEVEYRQQIIDLSQAEERLATDPSALDDLRAMGVGYVYIGRMGDFSGAGLDAAQLGQAEGATVVYQAGGVTILQLEGTGP